MNSLNKASLIGNLGKDPEIRTMQSGKKLAEFSLGTSESWKDKQTGERKQVTEWHKVVVYNEQLVSIIETYVKKGTKLYIEGTLKTRKWQDKNGVEKYTTEIILQNAQAAMVLLQNGNTEQSAVAKNTKPANLSNYDHSADLDDDEIPF